MENYLINNWWVVLLLALWVLPWKGVALWRAAQNSQKYWFIALLVINSLAILEIIYIFYFSKKAPLEKESPEDTHSA
ncbi:MAG: hypothetical protein HZC14_03825 [Candidatus Niyogibacteria bacterium]|nr:hypothetical protein [Candidatus Niyogibacteria bacterium]